jgi:3-phosphoglycerate kinase
MHSNTHPPLQVCLLENLRYHPGEVDNCQHFAQQLASLADVYVNDAFAVCHRQQASVTVSSSTALTAHPVRLALIWMGDRVCVFFAL